MTQPDYELLDAEQRLMAKSQAYNDMLKAQSGGSLIDAIAAIAARDAYQAALRDVDYLRHRDRTR